MYGTRFGTLNQAAADGQVASGAASTTQTVTTTITGATAEVTYAGAAPGLIVGAVQISVRIPKDIAPDPAVPISLSIGSAVTPPGVTVSIQ